MKVLFKRIVSVLLAASLVYSLIVPAFARVPTQEEKNSWVEASTVMGEKLDPQSAYNKVISDISSAINQCRTAFSDPTSASAGQVLVLFTQAAVALDWLTYNYYKTDDTNIYSVFRIPNSAQASNQVVDITQVKQLLDSYDRLRVELLSNSQVINQSNDFANGKINESLALGLGLTGYSRFLDVTATDGSGDITNDSTYMTIIRQFLSDYCDAHVLVALSNKMSELASVDRSSLAALRQNIDLKLSLSTDAEAVSKIVQQYGSELYPYLKLYNDIMSLISVYAGLSLADFTQDGVRYTGVRLSGRNYTQYVSSTTTALWRAMFTSTSNMSQWTTDLISNIDISNGALGLMSNATIQGNQIMLPDNPELTDIGYAILAAGATYDPFVSIAGNDAFISVIESFLTNTEQRDNLVQVLQVALNTKKPLFKTESGQGAWKNADDLTAISMANYSQASLADVLQIDENITRAYAVVRGQMTPSQVDSSTWEYVNQGTAHLNASDTPIITDNNATGTVSGVTSGAKITVGSMEFSASSYQMTLPVMITAGRAEKFFTGDSTGFAASVGGLTSLIIHNAAMDVKGSKYLQTPETQLLFLNGLGDIVLSDNTVILPAIANPLLYNYGTQYAGKAEEDYVNTFTQETSDYLAYYPYTAAFMNHYPNVYVGANGHMSSGGDTDLNKYLLLVDEDTLIAKRVKQTGSSAEVTARGGVLVASIYGASFNVSADDSVKLAVLNIAKGQAGISGRQGIWSWGVIGLFADEYIMTKASAVNPATGTPYYPLNTSNSDVAGNYLAQASPLTTSALRFISNPDVGTGSKVSAGTFRIAHYIENFLGEGMLGSSYAETIEKNYKISYDDLVADTGNRFLKFLVQICDSAIENLGRIDGVLAVKDPYQNEFFNLIVRFIQDFYLLIAAALMIVVAVKFLKGHYSLLFVGFIGLLCIAGFEVYAHWLPTLVPSAYNFAVNDAIEDIVWNTVAHKAEQYDESYKDSNRVDVATGALKPYTATLTLYTLSNAEMESLAARTGVSVEDLRKGEQVFLDSNAGIFAQGNQIKISVDRLLVNNSMRGLYLSQWQQLYADGDSSAVFLEPEDSNAAVDNPYTIQLQNAYVSLESYYTPYDHFERALLEQLNTFSTVFMVERNVVCYGENELYKDAFIVNAYTHSAIFLSPGSEEALRGNIVTNSIVGAAGTVAFSEDDLVNLCIYYFKLDDENLRNDWLNIYGIFEHPDAGFRDSLWGHVLQSRGWYDDDWQITELGNRKLSDLIAYVNKHSKLWIINNESQINSCSDENAIKLISLYATTCFTHYVSEFGQWLYPNYVNAADLELKDVLYGSMTTLRDRNHAYDGTVVNTVALNLGIFGVIFLLLIIVFATVFVFVITYLVPILYALFGAILIFKLINDEQSVGLVKGYVKVTGVTCLLYLIFSLSLKLVKVGGYNWYGYLGCALVIMLCVYFLFWVVLSVIQDAGELGNNTLAKNLMKGFDNITRGAVTKLVANSTQLSARYGRSYTTSILSRYSRRANIDRYDQPMASRNPGGWFKRNPILPPRSSAPSNGYDRNAYYDGGESVSFRVEETKDV